MGGEGSEDTHGVCVIADHRKCEYRDDKRIIKNLFKDVLGYEIHEVCDIENSKTENVSKLSVCDALLELDEHNTCHRLVLCIFGECDPENVTDYKETTVSDSIDSDDYLNWLSNLINKPKIVISHMWHKSYPKESDGDNALGADGVFHCNTNALRVSSKIIDKNGDFAKQPPLFMESMNRIFRKFRTECDIIELFTKVLRDVEITQAIQRNTQNNGHDVVHNATFDNYLAENFTMLTCDNRVTDRPNAKHGHFSLEPELYKDMDRYSQFVLKKIPSVKIELKDHRLQNDITKYPMDKNPRGYCLIINFSNDRLGSFLDEVRMYQLFKELYFKILVINNRSHEEIEIELKRLATLIEKGNENPQCLFIILMGHGGLDFEDKRYNKRDRGTQTKERLAFDLGENNMNKETSAQTNVTHGPGDDISAEHTDIDVQIGIPVYSGKASKESVYTIHLEKTTLTEEQIIRRIKVGVEEKNVETEKAARVKHVQTGVPAEEKETQVDMPEQRTDVSLQKKNKDEPNVLLHDEEAQTGVPVHKTALYSKEVQTKTPEHKVYVFKDINKRKRSPNYLFEPFEGKNCTALSGKPKICVLQTCFGEGKMQGWTMSIGDIKETDQEQGDGRNPRLSGDNIPNGTTVIGESNSNLAVAHEKSDWYKLNATIKGFKSYRTQDKGSYVIDSLDAKFREHAARSDISQLMTMVTGEVSKKGKTKKGKWQQPECRTYFNGSLYLNPGFTKPSYPKLPVNEAGLVEITRILPGSVCWSAGEYVAVASNTNAKLTLIPIADSTKKRVSFNLHGVSSSLYGVIAGCMLSEDIHVIISTTPTWSREIVAVHLGKIQAEAEAETDDERIKPIEGEIKTRIELTQTIVNPLTICEINDDCFGVLRGTPNTYEDVTIEVYTNDTILSIMKDNAQSTIEQHNTSVSSSASSESEEVLEEDDETPIQAEYVIRIKYAKGRKINLRDKLCYSRTKFYILSFYECKVYRVNVNGKIEKSKKAFGGKQPVALLRGPDDTIDVACSHAVYTDVFGKESKVFPLGDNYASNMLVLLDKAAESGKVSGRIIILNDPGMDHNTFSLIPKFELRHLKQQNVIKSSSSIKHQCVWPTNKQTNKQGVVAVGSAESCHISLASSTSKSLDQVFVDGINSAAKIVQAIHLNDSTHLVMFQTVEYENNVILKLINIDSKIEMNNDFTYRSTEENKKESFEKPAVIFGIDNHTFGVVCKVSGNGVGIRIFKRKPSSGSNYSLCKEVKLEKPCVEYMNDSACVDANGEFYISNCEKHEVNHFDVNGKLIETLRTVNSDEQPLDPYKVMVDKNNTLFILCQEAIYRLNPEKKWAEEFKFETKSKPNAVPEHPSGDGQPDSNMPSPSADQTKAMDSSPSASGATSETNGEPETTGGSWDVCFNGNFMYSVFEETLDVYAPIKCTDEALGKPQEAETEPFTDPKTPESTT